MSTIGTFLINSMFKKALITGVCGQDGAYMAEFLLNKGYEVIGVAFDDDKKNLWRLNELDILSNIKIIKGDITDETFLVEIIKSFQPDECYNYAAISFVGSSWKFPRETLKVNADAVVIFLEAIQKFSSHTRFYQPGSSEMFGRPNKSMQNEQTKFNPCNPYGISKVAAYNFVSMYRNAYNIYACNVICYNHESPLRPLEYVTRKITDGVARISQGIQKELRLGNIEVSRDWGYAKDYILGQWLALQQDKPDDYILSTGKIHKIEEFLAIAFKYVGITDWHKYIVEDKRFYRPLEPFQLCGDSSKAKELLGWKHSLSFEELVELMVEADLKRLRI